MEDLEKALVGGDYSCIANACMTIPPLREEMLGLMFSTISLECGRLSQDTSCTLRKMSVSELKAFSWNKIITQLEMFAPTLLKLLQVVTSCNDRRNKLKKGDAHNPGVCMAVAVLLKERCMHVSGLQSLVSLLLYVSHANKVVSQLHVHNYIGVFKYMRACILRCTIGSTS